MTIARDAHGKVVGQVTNLRAKNPDAVTHPERWLVIVNQFSQYADILRSSVRLEEVRD